MSDGEFDALEELALLGSAWGDAGESAFSGGEDGGLAIYAEVAFLFGGAVAVVAVAFEGGVYDGEVGGCLVLGTGWGNGCFCWGWKCGGRLKDEEAG